MPTGIVNLKTENDKLRAKVALLESVAKPDEMLQARIDQMLQAAFVLKAQVRAAEAMLSGIVKDFEAMVEGRGNCPMEENQ